jgi:hypothetical protein
MANKKWTFPEILISEIEFLSIRMDRTKKLHNKYRNEINPQISSKEIMIGFDMGLDMTQFRIKKKKKTNIN